MFRVVAVALLIATHHHADGVGHFTYERNIKRKILDLERGLIFDSLSKVREIRPMKAHYSSSGSFTVGQTICAIRHRFARMTFLYMMAVENFGIANSATLVKMLIEMQGIWWHVDHLAEMIELSEAESNEKEQANVERDRNNKKEQRKTRPASSDRMSWQHQKANKKIVRQEEGKDEETARDGRMGWEDQPGNKKITRQGTGKDEETNKYINGFDTDFNR